jgi:hypothetical protein
VAEVKEVLRAQQHDTAAAVAEKDGFAAKTAEFYEQLVAVQAELSKQRSANEEVRPCACSASCVHVRQDV